VPTHPYEVCSGSVCLAPVELLASIQVVEELQTQSGYLLHGLDRTPSRIIQ
jgi:hypothetical protein